MSQRFWSDMGSTPETGTWVMDLTPEITRYAKAGSAKELWGWLAKDERKWRKRARRPDTGPLGQPTKAGREWMAHYIVPLILGVLGAVIAGAILWRLGLH
ncbi:MAG: hypothetical protein V4510_10395 [bacterium]